MQSPLWKKSTIARNSVQNQSKIYPKFIKNQSKIHPKSIKIPPKTVPGPLWMPNRVPDGSGEASGRTPGNQKSIFSEKVCHKGRFWEPSKIENGPKIALVRLGRHFGPPKMPSGRGFGKNMKI